jgi:DNA-binding NarL/FixJ family response regulator
MAPIRVLLVDDSARFLDSTARVLLGDPALEVVGRALSGEEGLEEIARVGCDLALVDVCMPGLNGLEVARRLRKLAAPPRVLLLSLNDNAEYRAAAAECADGFLDKSLVVTHLLPLIHSLFEPADA